MLARLFEIPPLQWIGDRSVIATAPHGDRELKIREPRPNGEGTV